MGFLITIGLTKLPPPQTLQGIPPLLFTWLFLILIQFLVHIFTYLQLGRWYFKDLVLNMTISSPAAVTSSLKTMENETIKAGIKNTNKNLVFDNVFKLRLLIKQKAKPPLKATRLFI